MMPFDGDRGTRCDGLTRRSFLRMGALSAGAVGLSLADLAHLPAAAPPARDRHCILLMLVGGPSHLDTWDPKPDAPAEVRGPFRPIRTNVPGLHLSELFPRMARRADRYAVVRSLHHQEAPIHEAGLQLLQTGRLSAHGEEQPHCGAVASHLLGRRRVGTPAFVALPGPIESTGVQIGHGQTAGWLGAEHQPYFLTPSLADGMLESDAPESRYGDSAFGRSCLLARQLVEHGVRCVTVNMFETVFNHVTWDCHADGGALATTLDDYRDTLCPAFDQAYTALLDDLEERGLLESTLVVATGEFGRTPRLNPRGGRDHWPGCWSALFAGGGVRGGQVLGASDALGAEPRERPVPAAAVAATIYRALGIDPATRLPGTDGRTAPLVEAAPIEELFRG